jgi:peptide/nickel transport system substrate-binding protein
MVAAALVFIAGLGFAQSLPVPREQSVVIETDQTYQYFNTANPSKPFGTQWGSGWHQVAAEWDWYENYATGERRLWRTTGWEYNRDATQLTWHVRKGVTWNDGVPYTAQDIVYTFQMWMKDPSLGDAGNADNVASVSAPDDYTVIFKFKEADFRWHNHMRMWGGGYIRPKHIYEKIDPKTFNNWPPIETGPYKLQGWYQDLGLFVWERDPNYWGTKVMGQTPGPRYVVFRSAPPPDQDLQEFVKGNVDEPLPHIFTIDMIRAAEKQWTHTVRSPYMDAVSQGIAGFNCALPPTDDVKFRWAIQYLLNRPKFERVYPMADSTAQTMWPWPAWGTLAKWQIPAIKNKYGPLLRYDPAEAVKQLDAAGYKKGADGLRRLPNGKPFTVVLVSGRAPDVGFLQASDFSDELRKVGIDNVLKISQAGITQQQMQQGEMNILFDVLEIYTSFPADPWEFIDSYHSKWAKPLGFNQLSKDRARARLKDPQLDALADKMRATDPDSTAYLPLVQQALDRWYTDLPAVPAVEKTFVQIFSDKYWTNWPKEGNWYEVPYQWWPSSIFVLFKLKPVAQ